MIVEKIALKGSQVEKCMKENNGKVEGGGKGG